MPAPAEISLIFQGPVVGSPKDPPASQITRLALESARRALPGSEIILSTWAGSDVTGLAADKILLNADPGNWQRDDGAVCNINRQIVSTREGLRAASRPFAAKIRTDTALTTGAFADLPRAANHRSPRWSIFAERILTLERFARDPARLPLLHHIGDLFQFGLREDLLLLWDIPLNRAENYQGWATRHPHWLNPLPDNRVYMRQGDEQYIWMECVRKKFPEVDLLYPWQLKLSTVPLSEALLTANFAIVTNEQAGIKLPDRFITGGWSTTCYHSSDWPHLTDLYQREGNALPQFVRCLRVYCRLVFLLACDLFKSIPGILPFMWRKLKNFLRPYRHRLGRKLLHLPAGDPPPPPPVTEIPVIALGDILGERRPVVTLPVMRYEDGMLPSAEALALLAILAAERPREVLEIGTYMGHTAKLMAECVETAIIHTVDLPENFSPQDDASTLPKDDLHLIQRRIVGREFKNQPCSKNIRQHFADTATWDFLAAGHPGFFFIDGSHTYEHCLHDSEKCLSIAARPAVFLWHDCDEAHPGVAKFILEWRQLGRDIRRIAGTPIAYWKYPGTLG